MQSIIYIPAVAATQALIAGEIQLAQTTGVSTSGAILAGADVRIVASSLNRIVGFIYARPEIKTPEQLKGKTRRIAIRHGERNWGSDFSRALRPQARHGRRPFFR